MKSDQVDSIINSLAKVVEDLRAFKQTQITSTTPSPQACCSATPPPQVCCTTATPYSCCSCC